VFFVLFQTAFDIRPSYRNKIISGMPIFPIKTMTDAYGPFPAGLRRCGGLQQESPRESQSVLAPAPPANENDEELKEEELRSEANLGGYAADSAFRESPLMDVVESDHIFRKAAALSVCVWLSLLANDDSTSDAQEPVPTEEAEGNGGRMTGMLQRKVAKRTFSMMATPTTLQHEDEYLHHAKKRRIQVPSTVIADLSLQEEKEGEEDAAMLPSGVAPFPQDARYPLGAPTGSAWSYSVDDWRETRTSARLRKTQSLEGPSVAVAELSLQEEEAPEEEEGEQARLSKKQSLERPSALLADLSLQEEELEDTEEEEEPPANENDEELKEEELRSNTNLGGDAADGAFHESPLIDVVESDRIFRKAAALSVCVWLSLLVAVYAITPSDEWGYLQGPEREAAAFACYVLIVSLFFVWINPLGVMWVHGNVNGLGRSSNKGSGILVAAMAAQCTAIATNALLAWAPTVVRVDTITGARVFLIRWCEWVPLAGLMTFLAEAVDLPREKSGNRAQIYSALRQSLSCFCGLLFPFCPNAYMWGTCIAISWWSFLGIFPRVWTKRQRFLRTPRGRSLVEMEHYDRVAFAYYLVLSCSVVWTVLVVFFMSNWLFIRFLFPDDLTHWLRQPHLAMILDTSFDVLSKAICMKLIVDVHRMVYDEDGRPRRQLEELRGLTTILWDSVSDAVVISVRYADKTTTMFNPTFQTMVGGGLPSSVAQRSTLVLILESASNCEEITGPSAAYYADSAYKYMPQRDAATAGLSSPTDLNIDNLPTLALDSHLVKEAWGIFSAAWDSMSDSTNTRQLSVHPMRRADGEDLSCELKVSTNSENSRIVVVRDVTERYRRFEAERRAHVESLARQQDARAINRFTRHEVKNGLLAGIELCDSLKSADVDIANHKQLAQGADGGGPGLGGKTGENEPHVDSAVTQIQAGMSRVIRELDSQLHETLDTVLAEAMARDIIHEVYEPRLEQVNIKDLLTGSAIDIGHSVVFPLELIPADFPNLLLDPQQVRYIHRNAVSNACKYGKPGGVVKTTVLYNSFKKELVMRVTNEPGHGHGEIMALGEDAHLTVFAQGELLHDHLQSGNKHVSSGDGAWIMQKCARTMKGECRIQFDKDQTVFCFTCPAATLAASEWSSARDFKLPYDTWGIAIDDSRIQRRIMTRIMLHAGVDDSRLVVLGKEASEVHGLGDRLARLLRADSNAKFLVLVDENLDFRETDSEQVVLSGSVLLKEILHSMPREDEARVLVLVRSANDSAKDVARYAERTHGCFPKAPMQRERVREILAPLWTKRFPATHLHCRSDSETSIDLQEDFAESLRRVDGLINDGSGTDSWSAIWCVLHQLKGDLMILEPSSNLNGVTSLIESMRGLSMPTDFPVKWAMLRRMLEHELESR
jgi:hypothetical protein